MPCHRTHFKTFATVLAALVLTACTSEWEDVYVATVSEDEQTLTVNMTIRPPNSEGEFCERVTGTEVSESTSQVIIGVQVEDNCASWPWENGVHLDIGYRYPVQLKLKAPLGERVVVSKRGHRKVQIIRPTSGP